MVECVGLQGLKYVLFCMFMISGLQCIWFKAQDFRVTQVGCIVRACRV